MSIGGLYRGREGMISWALHRITGLGVLLFLLIHIADIFIVRYGAEAFDDLLVIYKGTPFRLLEIGLVASVYFHAVNGLRVIAIDFWDGAADRQRELFWGVIIVFTLMFVPTAILMLIAMFD
ncbi:MAG: succinate dehydrogenase, cytochrome b556 subunit [Thermomicrobiales bacterium]